MLKLDIIARRRFHFQPDEVRSNSITKSSSFYYVPGEAPWSETEILELERALREFVINIEQMDWYQLCRLADALETIFDITGFLRAASTATLDIYW